MRRLLSSPLIRYNYLKDFKKPVVESKSLLNQYLHLNLQSIFTKPNIILIRFLIWIWVLKITIIITNGWTSYMENKTNINSSILYTM